MLALTAFAITDRTHSPRAPVVTMIRTPHALVPVTKLRLPSLTTTSDRLQRRRSDLRSLNSRPFLDGQTLESRVTNGILLWEGRPHTKTFNTPPRQQEILLEKHSPADARLAARSGDEPRDEPDALRSCRHRRDTTEPWQATSFLELGKVVVLSAEDGTQALQFVLGQAGPRLPPRFRWGFTAGKRPG